MGRYSFLKFLEAMSIMSFSIIVLIQVRISVLRLIPLFRGDTYEAEILSFKECKSAGGKYTVVGLYLEEVEAFHDLKVDRIDNTKYKAGEKISVDVFTSSKLTCVEAGSLKGITPFRQWLTVKLGLVSAVLLLAIAILQELTRYKFV